MNKKIIFFITLLLLIDPVLSANNKTESENVLENNWTDVGIVGNGYPGVICMAVCNNILFSVADFTDVYKYNDDKTWSYVGTPGIEDIYVLREYKDHLYAGGAGSPAKVYRYDGGNTWTYVGTPGGLTGSHIFSMTVYNGSLYVGKYEGYVYRYDGGTNWTYVGNPGGSLLELWVNVLTVYDGKLYAGKIAGFLPEGARLYCYVGGTSWSYAGEPGRPENFQIESLIVYNNSLYAGNYDGTISKYNGGINWIEVGSVYGLVRCLGECSGKLYAASGDNLHTETHFYRYDNESEWIDVGSPVLGGFFTTLKYYDKKLYVGGMGSFNGHVYRYDGAGIIEIGELNGGIGRFTFEVLNTGNGEAVNVDWHVKVKGGIFKLINISDQGCIESIMAGDKKEKSIGHIFGLGKINLNISVEEEEKTAEGFVIGPIVLIRD